METLFDILKDVLTYNRLNEYLLQRDNVNEFITNEYFITRKDDASHLLFMIEDMTCLVDVDTILNNYSQQIDLSGIVSYNISSNFYCNQLYYCNDNNDNNDNEESSLFKGTILKGYYNKGIFNIEDAIFIRGVCQVDYSFSERYDNIMQEIIESGYCKNMVMKEYHKNNYVIQLESNNYKLIPNSNKGKIYIYSLVNDKLTYDDITINYSLDYIGGLDYELVNSSMVDAYENKRVFMVTKKSNIPEIYNLSFKGKHIEPARITTLEMSKWMDSLFNKVNDDNGIKMLCGYDDNTKSWIPLTVCN